MYHCTHPIYKYDQQEGRDVWFSCGTCILCTTHNLEAFQMEVDSIHWQGIKEYMKYYFLTLEEPLLEEIVTCQDPQLEVKYDMFSKDKAITEYTACGACPRCQKRQRAWEQEEIDYAEAAAYQ